MNQSTCIFGRCGNQVSAGTMQKLTRTKTPAHWPRKAKQNGLLKWSSSAFSGRETKWLSYAWEDHVLNINLCVKSLIPRRFQSYFQRSAVLCNKLGVPVTIPRRANRQNYRNNCPAANPEECLGALYLFLIWIN